MKYEEGSSHPQARYDHTAVQKGQKMYVFGGQTIDEVRTVKIFNDLWMIDLGKPFISWTNISQTTTGIPPEPRYGHSAQILRKMIVIFGGKNNNRIMNDLHLFDIERRIWIQPIVTGQIPSPRYYHAMSVYNDYEEIWMLGGKVDTFK